MVKKEFTKIISPSGDDRLRMIIETERGQVIDVVVQYEAKFGEEWQPIVRYDCSHGFLGMSYSLEVKKRNILWKYQT